MSTRPAAVQTRGLGRTFGGLSAVADVDLLVEQGTVHAVLGPNGAGKTTTIRMLTTLLRPTHGTAQVLGHDIGRAPHRVRGLIGVTGQYAALDEPLTARENLLVPARLLGMRRRDAARRADELLATMDLLDVADRPVRTFSGGMRRRLDIAASLVVTPRLLFLDEPTTGLDPRTRSWIWDVVRGLVADGGTVMLTTQYLEEADLLADQVTVLDAGRVVARGTPSELKADIGGVRIELSTAEVVSADVAMVLLAQAGLTPDRTGPSRVVAGVPDVDTGLALLRRLSEGDVSILDAGVRPPTLDEVFLHLTTTPGGRHRAATGVTA